MILQRIELENYGPYKGVISLDLSITDNENVILVQGLNDTGKTSLYKAIQFCLYGESNVLQYQKHVNRTKREIEDGITSVTIVFEHNNENYQITRRIEFKKTPMDENLNISNPVSFSVIRNGMPESITSIEDERRFIEYILPEEASQFFLFDGEEIQGYTQNPPKPNIKSAIEMLLGIKELLNAVDYLKKIKSIQEQKVRNELAKKEEYAGEKEDLDKLDESITKKDNEIIEMESQIQSLVEQKSRFETKLKQFEEVKDILEQKKISEEKLEKTERELSDTVESLKDFNDNELAIWLLIPFLKKFKDTKKSSFDAHTKKIVSEILKNNSCICDRPLDEHSISVLSDIVNSETSEFEEIQNCANEILDKFGINQNKEHFLRLTTALTELQERKISLESDIESKNSELGTKSTHDNEYSNIRSEYEICENNLRQKRIKNSDLRSRRDEEKRQYDSRYRFLSNKNISAEYEKENKRRMLIELTLKSINQFIDEIVESRKLEIENIASQFLKSITNAPDVYTGIELDEQYRLHLKIKDHSTVPSWERGPSAGQSQVIAHSFIAGLNKFTAKEAPIIIDTPLARLDDVHAENIVRSYPHMGKQIIVLYQPRELDEQLIELIRTHIRFEYDIKRDLTDIENSTITRREN